MNDRLAESTEFDLDRAVQALASGERAVLSAVFDYLWPRLCAFARRQLQDEQEAEDAAQRALEKLFAQVSNYDSEHSALAWAVSITAWECRTIQQQRRRRGAFEERARGEQLAAPQQCAADSPEQLAMQQQVLAAAEVAFGQLSLLDRETIATLLNSGEAPTVNGATFRKRCQRALERFRRSWRNIYGH